MISFNTISDIIKITREESVTFSDVIITYETHSQQKPRTEIIADMYGNWDVMKTAIVNGLQTSEKSFSGLTGGDAVRLNAHAGKSLLGYAAGTAEAAAVAVAERNAAMGRIVACPTAGSCGILPAVLYALQLWQDNISDEQIVLSMFTAAGIGMVIDQNACIAGAEGGCQAECGTAAAMSAGAAVDLMGGTPDMIANAAALALKNLLGLVCDPVAGLVEVPCVKRNGFDAVHALVAADMALAGVHSVIPVDEVIDAMSRIGNALPPSLRETAMDGLATTSTGQAAAKRILTMA